MDKYKVIKKSQTGQKQISFIVQNENGIIDKIKMLKNEVDYKEGDIIDLKYLDSNNENLLYKDYNRVQSKEDIVYKYVLAEIANMLRKKNIDGLKDVLLPNKPEKDVRIPKHEKCAGKTNNDKREKTICRCMYHYNRNPSICKNCSLETRWNNIGEIQIIEYEYPTKHKWGKIGGIDLILKRNDEIYLTELKPVNSKETLTRMFAEILTYYQDIENIKNKFDQEYSQYILKPAICFFKDSQQEKDFYKYRKEVPDDFNLIMKYISIFRITETNCNNDIIDFKIEIIE